MPNQNKINNSETAFINDDSIVNKKIEPISMPSKQIGVDTEDSLLNNIVSEGTTSQIDVSAINSFSQAAQTKQEVYNLLDTMGEDATISAILETYAEDATEYNDQGKVVWVESNDSNISDYITFLLDTMNVDKNVYSWVYNLCKYGDVYIKLFRESDYEDKLFNKKEINKLQESKEGLLLKKLNEEDEKNSTKFNEEPLNESIKIKAYKNNDKFVHYVEMVANPAVMFELTKFGKTYGYIKADAGTISNKQNKLQNTFYTYNFNSNDITIYQATDFVHACLEGNSNRTSEEVNIFLSNNSEDADSLKYTVKRGQSLLYNSFKVWRELNLLENSILLNRVTKSSIVRIIGIEVGDMPKESVGPHLLNVKGMIEQRVAIKEGSSLNEYTNPGPVENNIYIPTRGGVGAITPQEMGGEVNVGQLTDIDYFKNKFYGCLRGDTLISLSNGDNITVEQMHDDTGKYIGAKINCCDSDGNVRETEIVDVILTKPKAKFLRITLENDKYIDVTPEHLMMLSDGTFKEAQDLTDADELMPIDK